MSEWMLQTPTEPARGFEPPTHGLRNRSSTDRATPAAGPAASNALLESIPASALTAHCRGSPCQRPTNCLRLLRPPIPVSGHSIQASLSVSQLGRLLIPRCMG